MPDIIQFNSKKCRKCGLCAEVCPNKIIKKESSGEMSVRQDRAFLCFQCGQCMAVCPAYAINTYGLTYVEDFFNLPKSSSFKEPFFNMIESRRSVRNFKDKAVPKDMLEKIVQAIAFAPPSFPPIKTELIVVQDTTVIKKSLPYMIQTYDFIVKAMENPIVKLIIRLKAGRETFLTLVNHGIPIMKTRLPELKKASEDTITRNAPAMILFHANRNAENHKADIYIAATYGILAAHSLGLGATIIDLISNAVERNKELRKMFLIPDNNEVTAAMIVGYPAYKYQRGIKRELKTVKWI